jgi:hypothetical protein
MSQTPHFQLDYLLPEQAQKHVTLNDGLRRLDGLVQLSVVNRTQAQPPEAPKNGARYLIAEAAAAAWGQAPGQLALYEDTAWHFFTPRPGWRLWDEAGQELLVFNGTDWQSVAPQDDATSLITTQEAAVDITEASLITLPSHTIFFGVAIKVLDKIEGAQAWQLGVTGASNRFGNWLSLEAGSEIRGPTNPSVYWQNTPIVATPLNGEFTAGRVAVAIYYLQLPIPSAT